MRQLPDPREGDEIEARHVRDICEALRENEVIISAGSGLVVGPGPGKPLRLAASAAGGGAFGGPLILANSPGGVTARAGLVPGSGTVDLYGLVSGDVVRYRTGVGVYNLMGTAVAAGRYCYCAYDASGNLWVVNAEC